MFIPVHAYVLPMCKYTIEVLWYVSLGGYVYLSLVILIFRVGVNCVL